MTTRRSLLALGTLLPLTRVAYGFQKRLSPHESASVSLNDQTITITYGRPYLKGRTVGGVTPYGEVWRLGADEATKITCPLKVKLGPLTLPAGSYALFAITNKDKWTLIVNTVADQWGAFSYDKSKDLGRFDVPVRMLPAPLEEFTIAFKKQSSNSADLSFAWGKESVSTLIAAV